ncbi:endonuclease/exonuclease/phosphatase family protein [Phialemonium atrogriseum]|uniref:Endonuclease/exonuclease/phosphatase family protein n=1 Tax=Phialemonium atrogriseum TaxID=1093897 RepID=A0AAJ0FLA6_9PEZI|nr:endonuclease/exonuclease/phosphatase family protein [Phialemonium atrogriseum]KAK1771972.1 endonuclease/exonuclease/phosphatase family protein [Phialemonium atrogriseum]
MDQIKTLLNMALSPFQRTSQPAPPDLPLRIVTHNIRYATTSPARGEKPWPTRRPLLTTQLAQLASTAPAGAIVLLNMQEVLDRQLGDIREDLGADWAHVGVGRDDGAAAGEYNPILYRPAQARLLHSQTAWLSPTPAVPSFGWGAGSRRVVTAAVFEQVGGDGRRFIAANTHLDNVSSEAREKGVGVVLETIEALREAWGPLAVVLTGDFNSSPGEDAYRAMEGSGRAEDLYTAAGSERRFGPYETYTGFSPDDTPTRIDFIWLGPPAEKLWVVDRYEVLSNTRDDVFLSDHRAVVGDLRIVA